MTPEPLQTSQGYEEPFSAQFSVFLANRVGQLKELLNLMAEKAVEVLGVSVVDSSDWAVIRLVFSEPDKAALSEICGHLLHAEINVHFAYPLIGRRDAEPVMVLHVDDPVLATHLLTSHGIRLLGSEDLADPT